MLVIRLKRVGKKNKPYYRMVVADKKRAVSGKFLETLGSVDPHSKKRTLKKDRILYWISCGAQPSDTAFNLLVSENIISAPKRKKNIRPKKKGTEEIAAEGAENKEVKKEEAKPETKESEKPTAPETPATAPETEKTEAKPATEAKPEPEVKTETPAKAPEPEVKTKDK